MDGRTILRHPSTLILCFFANTDFLLQVLQPVQSYLDQAMAKDYMQESEQQKQDPQLHNDFKSYTELLREQRRPVPASLEQETIVADDFDYRPVKIPKKPDASESYLSLRLKHDKALMSQKKSKRYLSLY